VRVAVAGAGGHGRVVADAILASGELDLRGFLDDNPAIHATSVWDYPVLGYTASWAHQEIEGLILGVGDNARRRALYDQFRSSGARVLSITHPRATVGRGVSIGRGAVVLAQCVINADSVIGENVILNTASTVDHDCYLEPHAHLAPGVHLAGGVRIGEGAFLGIGAVVLPGVSIGAWATIGAGAVVLRDVEAHATVMGVPARSR
jgi:sugar O-acyltransferase (sialic acid O-acetyltransferase NeuD family)